MSAIKEYSGCDAAINLVAAASSRRPIPMHDTKMKSSLIPVIMMLTYCGLLHAGESGKHLFILSGQSNMARFKPKSWFTPGISEALGAENVIVSFHAQGGQPISKWYKQWKSTKGETDP